MTRKAYLFEAKGIQRWIMEGGRLRDIAAASNLLARSFASDDRDLLAPVLAQTGLKASFSRRAGGAFMLHYDAADQAAFDRFRALWRLVFMQSLPGFECVEAIGEGASDREARANAYDPTAQWRAAAGRENGLAGLPPYGHPLAEFSPRSGRPAVASRDGERLDAVTLAKRLQAGRGEAVGRKFAPEDGGAGWLWPNEMDDGDDTPITGWEPIRFPFTGEDRWVAVMHADISALGRFYAAVGKAAETAPDPVAVARQAAQAIEQAVIAAARIATAETLLPVARGHIVPARPIVLGGDDITIILRGDVALPFTARFLAALESESGARLATFAAGNRITHKAARGPLTAAAGVAFGKAKQPFFRLLDLAESLCGHAKARAKLDNPARPPSVLSFLRITESALAATAGEMFARLETPAGRLHAQPYRIGDAPGFVSVAALDRLRRELINPALPAGGLRELRTLLLQGQAGMAEAQWQRWQMIARRRGADAFTSFSARLAPLLAGPPLPLFGPDHATPLFDALEWNAIAEAAAP